MLSSELLPHRPILETPDNQTALVGENVTLSCKIMWSDTHPHIQWLKHFKRNGSWADEKGEQYIEIIKVCKSYVFSLATF